MYFFVTYVLFIILKKQQALKTKNLKQTTESILSGTAWFYRFVRLDHTGSHQNRKFHIVKSN